VNGKLFAAAKHVRYVGKGNNTLPHLHVHLLPRYKGDPFEEGPIDTRLIRESRFGEGEFESFKCSLQVSLSEG